LRYLQCWWFGYLNSACNPIIYAFRSQAFREGYRQVICWHGAGKPRRKSSFLLDFNVSVAEQLTQAYK